MVRDKQIPRRTTSLKSVSYCQIIYSSSARWCMFLGSLQIQQSLESDEGKYECVAKNKIGVAYSYGANLYVRGKFQRLPNLFAISRTLSSVVPY